MGTFGGFSGTEMPFTNLLKFSPPFKPMVVNGDPFNLPSYPCSLDTDFNFDQYGWAKSAYPLTCANNQWTLATALIENRSDHYEGGDYYVSFNGIGTLAFTSKNPAVAPITVAPTPTVYYDPATNVWTKRYKITLPAPSPTTGTTGLGIEILSSSGFPHHVRNMRVVHSAYYDLANETETSRYHPTFLSLLDKLGNGGTGGPKVLRVGKWKHISNSQVNNWADELHLDHATYAAAFTRGGVPHEAVLELCEIATADYWLQIPHLCNPYVNPGYLTALGAFLESWYAAGHVWPQRIFVEYTNEHWNGFFPQYQYMLDRFDQVVWAQPPAPPTDSAGKAAWYYAYASKKVYDDLKAAMPTYGSKLEWVLAGKFDDDAITGHIFTRVFADGGETFVKAFAIAPYVGVEFARSYFDWANVLALAGSPTSSLSDPTGGTGAPRPGLQWVTDTTENYVWNSTIPSLPSGFVSTEQRIDDQLAKVASFYGGTPPQLFAYEGGQSLLTRSDCTNYYLSSGAGYVSGVKDCDPATMTPTSCPCGGPGGEEQVVGAFYNKVNLNGILADGNGDMLMEGLYLQLMDLWRQKTVAQPDQLFLAFDFIERYGLGGAGSWGAGEWLHAGTSPTADLYPKFSGLQRSNQ